MVLMPYFGRQSLLTWDAEVLKRVLSKKGRSAVLTTAMGTTGCLTVQGFILGNPTLKGYTTWDDMETCVACTCYSIQYTCIPVYTAITRVALTHTPI